MRKGLASRGQTLVQFRPFRGLGLTVAARLQVRRDLALEAPVQGSIETNDQMFLTFRTVHGVTSEHFRGRSHRSIVARSIT